MDHHRHLQEKLASAVQDFRGIPRRHYPATVFAGCDHRSEVREEEGEYVYAYMAIRGEEGYPWEYDNY